MSSPVPRSLFLGSNSVLPYLLTIVVMIAAAQCGQFWISVAITLAMVAWSTRSVASWPAAIATGVTGVVLSAALVTTWSYLQPIPFTWLIVMLWAVIIAIGWFVRRSSAGRASLGDPWLALAVILPGVLTLLALVFGGALFGLQLGWMMLGDAQFNTVLVREVVESNGADPTYIWVPSLIQMLMAGGVAAATGGVASAENFVPLMQAQAQVLAVVWAIASLLFGLIGIVESRGARRWIRFLISMGAAAFPLGWYVLSFSIDAGFYNTSVVMLGLSLVWLFWREADGNEGALPAVGLWLAAVILAAAWVPLAIIPVVLVGYHSTTVLRHRRSSPHRFVAAVLGALIFAIYAALVVMPSYLAQSGGLTQPGRMAEISALDVLTMLLAAVLVAALAGIRFGRFGSLGLGLVLIASSAGFGLTFLLFSNRGMPSPWSYYPAKMGWLVGFFLVFLTALAVLVLLGRSHGVGSRLLGSGAVIALVALTLWALPPLKGGILRYFPLFSVARNGYVVDESVPAIASVVGTRTIYFDATNDDFLVNQWAFQWASVFSGDPIRSYAYTADINSVEGVCSAATTWGGQVTIVTANPAAVDELAQRCGEQILRFDTP